MMDLAEIVSNYVQSLERFDKDLQTDGNANLESVVSQELDRSKQLLAQLQVQQQQQHEREIERLQKATENVPLPEINGDIVETMSCVISDDNITDVSLVGEVAISNTNWNREASDLYMKFNNVNCVKINEDLLEVVDLVENVYRLNRGRDWGNGISGLAKYTVTNMPQVQCPILVTPVWQFREDETISMINLRPLISVNYTLLKVCIKIGKDADEILSKPTGYYNQTDGTIQWDLPSLDEDLVLIMRYKKSGAGTHAGVSSRVKPPHVRIDFTASQLLTQVNVEYGYSPDKLTGLPLNVMTISGNYKAE